MSYSVFKDQKSFNVKPALISGFLAEAADNLANSLRESTAFSKKVFQEQLFESPWAA